MSAIQQVLAGISGEISAVIGSDTYGLSSANGTYFSTIRINETQVLNIGTDTSFNGYINVGTVNGSVVSQGAQHQLTGTSGFNYLRGCYLAPNKVLLVCRKANPFYGTAYVVTIDNGVPVIGAVHSFIAENIAWTHADRLADNVALICFGDATGVPKVMKVMAAGYALSFSSAVTTSPSTTFSNSSRVYRVSNTKGIHFGRWGGSACHVDATSTPSCSSSITVLADNIWSKHAVMIDAERMLAVASNSYAIINVSSSAPSVEVSNTLGVSSSDLAATTVAGKFLTCTGGNLSLITTGVGSISQIAITACSGFATPSENGPLVQMSGDTYVLGGPGGRNKVITVTGIA